MVRNVFVGLGCFLFNSVFVMAAFDTPITTRGDTQTVSVSSYAWTQASELTNGDIGAQTGVFVCNYSSNSASIGFVCDTTTPSEGVSERWGELQPGEWDIIPCGEGLILYLVNYGGVGAQSAQTAEVRNTGF